MTEFRQLTVIASDNQAELLEELLFLADAQAVTLVDDDETPLPARTKPWSILQPNLYFRNFPNPHLNFILKKDCHLIKTDSNYASQERGKPKSMTPYPTGSLKRSMLVGAS